MCKELIRILLFFLAISVLISLLSHTPSDPSIHNAKSAEHIHNLLGRPGAWLSGVLLGLFGLGAFWVPVLLLGESIRFFTSHQKRTILPTIGGGLLLAASTGTLCAFQQDYYLILGRKVSGGGMIGIPMKMFFVSHLGHTGGGIALMLLWITGLILVSGLSAWLILCGNRCQKSVDQAVRRVRTAILIRRERRKRAKKREKAAASSLP